MISFGTARTDAQIKGQAVSETANFNDNGERRRGHFYTAANA